MRPCRMAASWRGCTLTPESEGGVCRALDERIGLGLDDLHDRLLGCPPRRSRLRRRPPRASPAARGEVVTVATRELTLVTQDDCHFCERAHELLRALGVSPREVAVDSAEAEALAARGIPLAFLRVLTDGERVVAYGRFSEKRGRKELARERPVDGWRTVSADAAFEG